MTKSKDKEKAKRLADLAGVGRAFEGEQVSMADIAGKEVTVVDFKFLPSQFRQGEDYITIQIEIGGELKVMNTAAQVISNTFKNITRDQLPAPAVFKQVRSEKSGRDYWTVE